MATQPSSVARYRKTVTLTARAFRLKFIGLNALFVLCYNSFTLRGYTMEERAIQAIMSFYRISREVACEWYWDEIEAYMKLMRVR